MGEFKSAVRLRGAALIAFALLAETAVGGSARSEERPSPHLLTAHDQRCDTGDTICERSDWVRFLQRNRLSDLTAPAGGRAYRWLWVQGGMAEQTGYVELLINADGRACLRSVWRRAPIRVGAADVARFEATLGATEFTRLPAQDPRAKTWLDYPPEQVMEVDTVRRYHFVHRIGGMTEPGVRDAGDLLEKLARHTRRKACADAR